MFIDTMTPTRGKRNSKVPERFSSEDLRIETSNTNGITILDYNDKTTSTTHRLAPIGTKIKLKPAIREPLKVKLPKLKRPTSTESPDQKQSRIRLSPASDDEETNMKFDFKSEKPINKIKLPSLSSRTNPASTKSINKKQSIKTPNSQIDSINQKPSSKDNAKKSRQSKVISGSHHSSVKLSSLLNNSYDSQRFPQGDPLNSSSSSDEVKSSEVVNSARTQSDIQKSDGNNNDSGIHCPCGMDADLGVMVECEKCLTWQHGHCINVGLEEDSYEGYICAFCLFPPGKHVESLHQLTVGDRFEHKFDQLAASMKTDTNAPNKLNNENRVQFSIDELVEATRDLKRVSNSLDVKWKLYLNREYPAELKIWTNALWSENREENLKQQQRTSCFFGDISRCNLELNIRNMICKMMKRASLIRNQISTMIADETILNEVDIKILNQNAKLLEEVSNLVEQVRNNLSMTP